MDKNYFSEQATSPSEASVAEALGKAYPWYRGLLEAAAGFEAEWKYHGSKYGWKLKVGDRAKALFELTLGTGRFQANVAAREAELESLGASSTSPGLVALLSAGRSKGGWGIRILVEDEGSYREASELVGALASLRREESGGEADGVKA